MADVVHAQAKAGGNAYEGKTSDDIFTAWRKRVHSHTEFLQLASEVPCIRAAVVDKYLQDQIKSNKSSYGYKKLRDEINEQGVSRITLDVNYLATQYIWKTDRASIDSILKSCADKVGFDPITGKYVGALEPGTPNSEVYIPVSRPFDRRLDRLEVNSLKGLQTTLTPYDTKFSDVATSGYLISREYLENLERYESTLSKKPERKISIKEMIAKRDEAQNQMLADSFYYGVPALQNAYALITLYGAEGGAKLVNQKGQRRWYEVDASPDQEFNFASAPTTSAIISWGQGDPYGRTPYFFTDFVFAKYWNKIPNNRLITLRRYAGPMYDNLKFPGMAGTINEQGQSSSPLTSFPPMASAITYFGGETGNSLNALLKFTTGVNWSEVQGEIWSVTATASAPEADQGLGSIFKGLGQVAKWLNVGAGEVDNEYIAAGGMLPPDPYTQGPFENRIRGPVNRIDKVWKRDPGMKYENNLSLVFEYVARPVGGINPKAVLLDIMSNFLVLGSATAVFFGGAHRFMINPAKYPFVGKQSKLYSGGVVPYMIDAIRSFTGEKGILEQVQSGLMSMIKDAIGFFTDLIKGNKGSGLASVQALLDDKNLSGRIAENFIAEKTAGQIPYLEGMKAILTGNPVGEWHVTIGNPLNPIAMIGNLICDSMTVEFGEELGPDDFPTEIKITVNLKHGMARDRDAIESIFNRGMGRTYSLPDGFLGTADMQTAIDPATKERVTVGYMKGAGTPKQGGMRFTYTKGQDSRNVSEEELRGTINQMHGSVSVWDRLHFHVGISENSEITPNLSKEMLRTAYRTADWIAERTLL